MTIYLTDGPGVWDPADIMPITVIVNGRTTHLTASGRLIRFAIWFVRRYIRGVISKY